MSGGHGGGHDTHDDHHDDDDSGPISTIAQILSKIDPSNKARMRTQLMIVVGCFAILVTGVVLVLSLSYFVLGGLYQAAMIPINLIALQIDKIKAEHIGTDMLLDGFLLLLEIIMFFAVPYILVKIIRIIVKRTEK